MIHTALLDLPTILESLGLNVIVSDGWENGQEYKGSPYLWTNPDNNTDRSFNYPPSCYMVHQTAGIKATIPSVAESNAGCWIGLLQSDGKLHQYGGGIPTIALTTAGPATTSSGFGYRPAAWDYTFKNLRAPWKAQGPDGDTALNRYAFNAETVCEGGGSNLDPGVWEHVVGLGVALHMLSKQWSDFTIPWDERTLGHDSWTRRKPGPDWSVNLPNDGAKAIIDIQDAVASNLAKGIDLSFLPMREGDGITDTDKTSVAKKSDVVIVQLLLNDIATVDPKLTTDGKYGPATSVAVASALGSQAVNGGASLTGRNFKRLLDKAHKAKFSNTAAVVSLEKRVAALETAEPPLYDDRYSLLGHGHLVTGTVTGETQ